MIDGIAVRLYDGQALQELDGFVGPVKMHMGICRYPHHERGRLSFVDNPPPCFNACSYGYTHTTRHRQEPFYRKLEFVGICANRLSFIVPNGDDLFGQFIQYRQYGLQN